MAPEDAVFTTLLKYTKALSVALGYRDHLTRLHSDRVGGLSEALGLRCGLSGQEMGILKIAASFHDIGKIGIPDHILLKPSRFDENEWETMKQHPVIGEEIMVATALDGSQQAASVIRHHHEHYNGLGYPDGLAGDEIPFCARIISIADCYDAMAVTRSYHGARVHHEIMDLMHNETGSKHDPGLMHIFCGMIEGSGFMATGI